MQEKHEQLGEYGAIPGAPNGPPLSQLEIHPLAAIFPPMSEKEFEKFVADIEIKGVIDPLWTHEGKVIDGRNRLLACQRLGITPTTREWDGKGSLLEFIISLNLRRRHLKERQRAMIAARMKPALEDEARCRMGHSEKDLAGVANWPHLGKSRDQAGALLSVSGKSVDRATKILELGIPDLIAAVDSCQLAVSSAADLSEFPHEEQERILAGGRTEIKKALQPIREARKRMRSAPPAVPDSAPAPVLDRIDEHLLRNFSAGRATLTKTVQGFQLALTDEFLDELRIATRSPDEFRQLVERGVTLILKKGDAA